MRSTFLGLAAVLMGLALLTGPAQAAFVYESSVTDFGGFISAEGNPSATLVATPPPNVPYSFEGSFENSAAVTLGDGGNNITFMLETGTPTVSSISGATIELFSGATSLGSTNLSFTNGLVSNMLTFTAVDAFDGPGFTFDNFVVNFTVNSLTGTRTYNKATLGITNASVAAVPEPEAYASFALGAMVLGLGAFYSMRRKQEVSVA